MSIAFKAGDKVRCIRNDNVSDRLTVGMIYTIEGLDCENDLYLEGVVIEARGDYDGFVKNRFELVETSAEKITEKPKKRRRLVI